MSASNLSLKTLVIGLGLALTLSGCGAKGPLEPPPSAATQQKPVAKADEGMGDIPVMGQKQKTKTAPIEAPKQPFLLDFLL